MNVEGNVRSRASIIKKYLHHRKEVWGEKLLPLPPESDVGIASAPQLENIRYHI